MASAKRAVSITAVMWQQVFEMAGDSAGEGSTFHNKVAAFLMENFQGGAFAAARVLELGFKTALADYGGGLSAAAATGLMEGFSDGVRLRLRELKAMPDAERAEAIASALGKGKKGTAKATGAHAPPPKVTPHDQVEDGTDLFGATTLMPDHLGVPCAEYISRMVYEGNHRNLLAMYHCAKHPDFMHQLARRAKQYRDAPDTMDLATAALVKTTLEKLQADAKVKADAKAKASMPFAKRAENFLTSGNGRIGAEADAAVEAATNFGNWVVKAMGLPASPAAAPTTATTTATATAAPTPGAGTVPAPRTNSWAEAKRKGLI